MENVERRNRRGKLIGFTDEVRIGGEDVTLFTHASLSIQLSFLVYIVDGLSTFEGEKSG